MNSLTEFTALLREFDLTEYESRILVFLMKEKQATAKEIFEFTAISITKIYQVLKLLKHKKLVDTSFTKPRIYKGFSPSKLLKKITSKREQEMKDLFYRGGKVLSKINKVELKPIREPCVKIYHTCDSKRVTI